VHFRNPAAAAPPTERSAKFLGKIRMRVLFSFTERANQPWTFDALVQSFRFGFASSVLGFQVSLRLEEGGAIREKKAAGFSFFPNEDVFGLWCNLTPIYEETQPTRTAILKPKTVSHGDEWGLQRAACEFRSAL
jgi:hypothetical protein